MVMQWRVRIIVLKYYTVATLVHIYNKNVCLLFRRTEATPTHLDSVNVITLTPSH